MTTDLKVQLKGELDGSPGVKGNDPGKGATSGPWQELRTLLQIIALPVTGQMHLLADDCCRLELLARALQAWRRELPWEVAAKLTPEQRQALLLLEQRMSQICHEVGSPQWTERAMRHSEGLRQARWLARMALIRFGWVLELPAYDSLHWSGAPCLS